ncbi:hypothetical protein CUJ83_03890 [Methanocella sp. CWC-04]|uniref:Uncharacterized protein n=1 Tax=Methanooceanicella nereidis TaxID=2052831 RepID=A0AAP2W6C7_9EURY|nr:hypothetical protein [Methanocella sp. CWC-04]MCD1294134.1 hypothetical protein [Methanocella sp. CWC-04]
MVKIFLLKDDSAQLYTIEGIVASVIMIITLSFVLGSITFVSPQTEKTSEMKMSVMAQDVLNILSVSDVNHPGDLKKYVCGWNGTGTDADNEVPLNDTYIGDLRDSISSGLPGNVQYNVRFRYDDGGVFTDKPVIWHGDPHDNAVAVSRLVTLNDEDYGDMYMSWFWNEPSRKNSMPKVVEVKLVVWHI